jgi:hypothetical protein
MDVLIVGLIIIGGLGALGIVAAWLGNRQQEREERKAAA